jgi:hypothetical protein
MKLLTRLLISSFFVFFLTFYAFSQGAVNLQWSTQQEFNTPESVFWLSEKHQLFVSNIAGKPSGFDGNGFISLMSDNGSLLKLHWVDGLNAPKGMGVVGNNLFVTDINQLVEIDIAKAAVIHRYPIEGSKFLNDIAVDANNNVYISDLDDSTIYRYADGKVTKWISDELLNGVNGLCVVGDTLYAGVNQAIFAILLKTEQLKQWSAIDCGIDGLEADGNGGFIYSDWQGHIYHHSYGKVARLIVDTTGKKVNAADIEFDGQFIYVPTFFDNRVMCYRLGK